MAILHINLSKIEQNAALVAGMLGPLGVRLVGVTKACLGNERVAEAMLAGGAAALADSRVENIVNLRRHFPGAELELLRSPVAGMGAPASAAGVDFPVTGRNLGAAADTCFVSSFAQAEALLSLSKARPQRLCLMVETGDGREGVPPELAAEEAHRICALDEAELVGLATNAACARPGAPLDEALTAFTAVLDVVPGALPDLSGDAAGGSGSEVSPWLISGGGSGLLKLLIDAEEDAAGAGSAKTHPLGPLTELRCGEALLLGRIPSGSTPGLFIPGAHRDAFILEAPILEVFQKSGRQQALLGFGVQDVGHSPLIPQQGGVSPAKITSDYFIANLSPEAQRSFHVSDRLTFLPPYYGLLAAMTSPYVGKHLID